MSITCEQFSIQVIAGTTVRVEAGDLNRLGTPVVSGANVTIARYNPNGTLGENGIMEHNDDDYWADFTMPNLIGVHTFKISADYNSAFYRATAYCDVRPF